MVSEFSMQVCVCWTFCILTTQENKAFLPIWEPQSIQVCRLLIHMWEAEMSPALVLPLPQQIRVDASLLI